LQARGHQLQDLIADFVAPGVVESLETVDIDHCQRKTTVERPQALVQRATPRQTGQLVVKRQSMGVLHDRNCHDHARDRAKP
jgi:hypothetical protein